MAAAFDFDPPSFSLGFDFDLDSDPGPSHRPDPVPSQPPPAKRPNLRTIIEDDDDDFESPVRVSVPEKHSALKRLRRGPAPVAPPCNPDDDIEDFSSQEDLPTGNIANYSTCSSSKSSLHEKKILTSESVNQCNIRKKAELSRSSGYNSEERNGGKIHGGVFPELTVSPLRKFQLIDSDSDDSPVRKRTANEGRYVNLSSKENQSTSTNCGTLGSETPSVGKCQARNEDLWKDFCSVKSPHIPTPAFDEICKEYFSSAKKTPEVNHIQTGNQSTKMKDANICNEYFSSAKRTPEVSHVQTGNQSIKMKDANNYTEGLPPAHSYFFHEDPRIQKLVRDRLPNFFPLGEWNNQTCSQQNASGIDYMGQFGHQSSSRQTSVRNNSVKNSAKTKKNVKKSQFDNVSPDSENWVNPKSCAGIPKDAGKRRVQATSSSASKPAGHWYTGSGGQKVFVNKNGQEFTGQAAYKQFKKETGGFKKSKNQAGAKKKTATKNKSARKK